MNFLGNLLGGIFFSAKAFGRVEREGEFVDVLLPIAEHAWAEDGSLSVFARGEIAKRVVGFSVDLAPIWKPQRIDDTPITIYWGKGSIRSTGPDSDAFLGLLARVYGISDTGQRMQLRTEINMASLGSNPEDLRETPAMIKIFFESGGSDSYAEAFINIDLGNRIIAFRDKNPEYHECILSSLRSGAG